MPRSGFDRGSRYTPSSQCSSSPVALIVGKSAPMAMPSPGTPGAWFPYRDRTPKARNGIVERMHLGCSKPQLTRHFHGSLIQQEAMVIWNRSLQNSVEAVPSPEDLHSSMVDIGVSESVIERVMVCFDMDDFCEARDETPALRFQRSYFHTFTGTVCDGSCRSCESTPTRISPEQHSRTKGTDSSSKSCVFCSIQPGPLGADEILALASGTITPCGRCARR
mmetsp:Transcript_17841/g.42053  ORF Transcript_17841/g.42053 Transcript_17841/m.42053 type:complete len:221 (-) Transcript_17841:38-700(-)